MASADIDQAILNAQSEVPPETSLNDRLDCVFMQVGPIAYFNNLPKILDALAPVASLRDPSSTE